MQENAAKKLKKEKQEVVEEETSTNSPMTENQDDETSNDTSIVVATTAMVKVPGKRGRKRKLPQPIVEEEQCESVEKKYARPADEHQNAKIKVVKHFLEDYGPQINYAYNLWTTNSKVLDKAIITDDDLTENPMKWTIEDVCTFFVKFCDEETTAKFYAQKVDGEALLSLCQKDLINLMNIKVGPAIKIYNRILHLRQEVMTKFAEF